ncbi:erv1 / alr family domain-containing protein [Ditylenchus destructor]|uniref:Sulfhydryl oxidase n=1 Tax=Ditylenchus destructor TaxID=166010 RepID=A0AAD4R999_9BILA|nr:erv1 / alr family domain-containing protein [Ditylenchus destructor]
MGAYKLFRLSNQYFSRTRKYRFMLINLLFLLLTFSFADANEKSLYNEGDNVLELDVNTFNSTIYNKPTAFLVEFYSSWCGHCIDYAPHFVKFATLVKHWKSIVVVGVVNCADEMNAPVCREHEIDAFPTLRYFKVNSKDKKDSVKFAGEKKDMALLSSTVAGYAKEDFDEKHPMTWPRLQLAPDRSSLSELWAGTNPNAVFLCVVVENLPTNYGYSMMINYANEIRAKIVVVLPTHPIAAQFGGVQVPALHIFKRQNPELPVYSSNTAITWIDMKEELDSLLAKEPLRETQSHDLNGSNKAQDWNQFEVQYLDLTTAMRYMLTQEIPRKSSISGKELSALRDWIHLLRKYAPGSDPIRRLLYRLDEWLRSQTQDIPADTWLNKLEEFQGQLGQPIPANTSYMACRGSKPYLRGYTCGLWTFMHAVTVQAYKAEKENTNFNPVNDVLEPIHQFIVQFLSCEICAKNFDKMTINNDLSHANKPEDTVLWLWRAHNNVNKRLSGEASDDPKFPKQQFPPSSVCAECSSSGVFDEQRTLQFLVSYYSDIKTDGVMPSPAYQMKEFEHGKLVKVANEHLNPKFRVKAGQVDKLEEAEARIQNEEGGPKRQWKPIDGDSYGNPMLDSSSADRKTFYFIWLLVVGLLLAFVYFKYRQNRSKFWKTFYYHDYKLLPWGRSHSPNYSRKYSA